MTRTDKPHFVVGVDDVMIADTRRAENNLINAIVEIKVFDRNDAPVHATGVTDATCASAL